MTNYLRAFCQRAADGGQAGQPIRFAASTEGVKRDGKNLATSQWRLENYQRNPVFLWVHDYYGRTLPIGRAEVKVEGAELVADVAFDQEDEFAKQVESKYRRGFLSAVSVGWDTYTDSNRQEFYDLLDISAVPVPGDPQALMERQARGLADLGQTLAHLLDGDAADENADGESNWDATAIGMMRVYDPSIQMPERDRKRLYNRLERQYRLLGKTAPEYLTHEQVEALGLEEVRGLFLEDEPALWPSLFAEARAGAVLNARNRGDLIQAQALIQSVLDRAAKEEQPKGEDPAATEEAAADESERLNSAALARILEQVNSIKI